MSSETIIKEYVEEELRTNGFGVLATVGNGQPHASLVAVTPMNDFVHLIFATYRSTCKYKNLINNGKVAILFENRSTRSLSQTDITVITAYGNATEVDMAVLDSPRNSHLMKHPELESFLSAPDCALIMVKVDAYQMVRGIDDITWWNINV